MRLGAADDCANKPSIEGKHKVNERGFMRLVVFFWIMMSAPALSNTLIKAVQSGSLNAVKKAVAVIENIDAFDGLRCTALHYAGMQGNSAIVSYLLGHGADAKIHNKDGKIAFQVTIAEQAMSAERAKTAALLLYASKGIAGRDQKGWTALYWAILSKDRELIDRLLDEGATLVRHAAPSRLVERQHAIEIAFLIQDQRLLNYLIDRLLEAEGENALKTAIKYNLYPLVEVFVARGFLENELYVKHDDDWEEGGNRENIQQVYHDQYHYDPYYNNYDSYGDNAGLMTLAVRTGNPELVTLLLDNGLSPDGQGDGIAPLKTALRQNTPEIFNLLIAYGAKTSYATLKDWNDMLGMAASHDNDTVSALISRFLHKHDIDELLNIVRDWYAAKRVLAVFDVLIEREVDITEHAGYALHKAIIANNSTLITGLLKRGVGVDVLNKKGHTPLIEAVIRGNRENVELLLEHGADASATSSDGHNALELAKMGHDRMTQYQSRMNADSYEKIAKLIAEYM